jgi:hypothetical protein
VSCLLQVNPWNSTALKAEKPFSAREKHSLIVFDSIKGEVTWQNPMKVSVCHSFSKFEIASNNTDSVEDASPDVSSLLS